MANEFYGVGRATREGWMLIEDPPPVNCRLEDREEYRERFETLRRMGAIVVGFRPLLGSRAWIFGLPPGEIDLDWLKAQAAKAGMLLPATHPDFTYRWRGRECIDPAERMAFHGDVMVYHLEKLCKSGASILSRRNAVVEEIKVWRRHREEWAATKVTR